MRPHLGDISQKIFVGKHHALRFALGARGEQDHGGFLERGFGCDHVGRQTSGEGGQLVAKVEVGAHILQIDQVAKPGEAGFQLLELAQFDKAMGGDDALDLRGFERAFSARPRRW